MPARRGRTVSAPAPPRSPPSGTEVPDLLALDRAAARALAALDEGVSSQREALAALRALSEACAKAAPEGVIARELRRFLEERGQAMRAFHLDRVERALARVGLAGTVAVEEAVSALEDALTLFSFLEGDSGAVRTLRRRLEEVKQGRPQRPRPFFARYLEHQKR
jgi:NADPH-dependent ferric siderophore reductase